MTGKILEARLAGLAPLEPPQSIANEGYKRTVLTILLSRCKAQPQPGSMMLIAYRHKVYRMFIGNQSEATFSISC